MRVENPGSERRRATRPRWRALAVTGAMLLPLLAYWPVRALITNSGFAAAGFEIDGNLQLDSGTYDWANAGGPSGPTTCSSLGAGTFANVGGPLSLFCANDAATGTKDNSISGHEQDTSVQVVCGSIPNGKSDLSNFYVASQFAKPSPSSTTAHSFLYLGWTINSTGGSADMDFEFNQLAQPAALQDGTAGTPCATGNGDTANLARSAGDLLLEYQFASGGNVISVKKSTWTTTAGATCATSQNPPCWGPETDLTAAAEAAAAINDSTTPDSFGGSNCPAPNTPPSKQETGCVINALSGGTLGPDQFGEAAIDLTAANVFPSNCTTFGSAYLKSRSSAVFTDAVKDYIAPIPVNITNCTTPTLTTSLSGLTNGAADPGTTVTDTATLSSFLGTNPPGGTVAFNVYSGTGSSACTGTPVETLPAGANATTGANGASLSASGTGTASAGPVTLTPLAAGHYEVQAVYSGDGSANLATKSVCSSEPIQIRAQPTLVTQLSASSATLGTSVSDTAILSGFLGSNPPGGTVTFNVYSGATGTVCTAGNLVESVPSSGTSLSAGTGANAGKAVATTTLTTGTGTAPTLAPGSYEVQAVYTGDGANNLGASSSCGSEPLTINKAQPTITTQASPTSTLTVNTQATISDTATFGNLVTGIAPTGPVTFTLFTDAGCTTPATYAAGDTPNSGNVTGTGGITGTGPFTATFSTKWTPTISPATTSTYTWGISWAGDGNYLPIPASGVQCGGNNETLTVQKATPSLATKMRLDDTATITGGSSPTGTITFQLYDNSTCTGNLVAQYSNVPISGGSASTVGLTPTSGGNTLQTTATTYSWKVTYNGDGFNNSVVLGCNTATSAEQVTTLYAP